MTFSSSRPFNAEEDSGVEKCVEKLLLLLRSVTARFECRVTSHSIRKIFDSVVEILVENDPRFEQCFPWADIASDVVREVGKGKVPEFCHVDLSDLRHELRGGPLDTRLRHILASTVHILLDFSSRSLAFVPKTIPSPPDKATLLLETRCISHHFGDLDAKDQGKHLPYSSGKSAINVPLDDGFNIVILRNDKAPPNGSIKHLEQVLDIMTFEAEESLKTIEDMGRYTVDRTFRATDAIRIANSLFSAGFSVLVRHQKQAFREALAVYFFAWVARLAMPNVRKPHKSQEPENLFHAQVRNIIYELLWFEPQKSSFVKPTEKGFSSISKRGFYHNPPTRTALLLFLESELDLADVAILENGHTSPQERSFSGGRTLVDYLLLMDGRLWGAARRSLQILYKALGNDLEIRKQLGKRFISNGISIINNAPHRDESSVVSFWKQLIASLEEAVQLTMLNPVLDLVRRYTPQRLATDTSSIERNPYQKSLPLLNVLMIGLHNKHDVYSFAVNDQHLLDVISILTFGHDMFPWSDSREVIQNLFAQRNAIERLATEQYNTARFFAMASSSDWHKIKTLLQITQIAILKLDNPPKDVAARISASSNPNSEPRNSDNTFPRGVRDARKAPSLFLPLHWLLGSLMLRTLSAVKYWANGATAAFFPSDSVDGSATAISDMVLQLISKPIIAIVLQSTLRTSTSSTIHQKEAASYVTPFRNKLRPAMNINFFLLQAALASVRPEVVLMRILDRFGLDEWVRDESPPVNLAHTEMLVEECLALIIGLITDRRYIAHTSLEDQTEYELVHHLAIGSSSREDLDKMFGTHVVSASTLSSLHEKVATSYRNESDALKHRAKVYLLRDTFYEAVNPYFFGYDREQRITVRRHLESRLLSNERYKIKLNQEMTSGPFSHVVEIVLTSSVLLKTFFATLRKCLREPSPRTEAILTCLMDFLTLGMCLTSDEMKRKLSKNVATALFREESDHRAGGSLISLVLSLAEEDSDLHPVFVEWVQTTFLPWIYDHGSFEVRQMLWERDRYRFETKPEEQNGPLETKSDHADVRADAIGGDGVTRRRMLQTKGSPDAGAHVVRSSSGGSFRDRKQPSAKNATILSNKQKAAPPASDTLVPQYFQGVALLPPVTVISSPNLHHKPSNIMSPKAHVDSNLRDVDMTKKHDTTKSAMRVGRGSEKVDEEAHLPEIRYRQEMEQEAATKQVPLAQTGGGKEASVGQLKAPDERGSKVHDSPDVGLQLGPDAEVQSRELHAALEEKEILRNELEKTRKREKELADEIRKLKENRDFYLQLPSDERKTQRTEPTEKMLPCNVELHDESQEPEPGKNEGTHPPNVRLENAHEKRNGDLETEGKLASTQMLQTSGNQLLDDVGNGSVITADEEHVDLSWLDTFQFPKELFGDCLETLNIQKSYSTSRSRRGLHQYLIDDEASLGRQGNKCSLGSVPLNESTDVNTNPSTNFREAKKADSLQTQFPRQKSTCSSLFDFYRSESGFDLPNHPNGLNERLDKGSKEHGSCGNTAGSDINAKMTKSKEAMDKNFLLEEVNPTEFLTITASQERWPDKNSGSAGLSTRKKKTKGRPRLDRIVEARRKWFKEVKEQLDRVDREQSRQIEQLRLRVEAQPQVSSLITDSISVLQQLSNASAHRSLHETLFSDSPISSCNASAASISAHDILPTSKLPSEIISLYGASDQVSYSSTRSGEQLDAHDHSNGVERHFTSLKPPAAAVAAEMRGGVSGSFDCNITAFPEVDTASDLGESRGRSHKREGDQDYEMENEVRELERSLFIERSKNSALEREFLQEKTDAGTFRKRIGQLQALLDNGDRARERLKSLSPNRKKTPV